MTGRVCVQVQLAPIQQILPEEILADILHLLPPYTLAKAACVCTQWAAIANRDSMWQEACYTAFQMEGREEILRHLRLQYRYSSGLLPHSNNVP